MLGALKVLNRRHLVELFLLFNDCFVLHIYLLLSLSHYELACIICVRCEDQKNKIRQFLWLYGFSINFNARRKKDIKSWISFCFFLIRFCVCMCVFVLRPSIKNLGTFFVSLDGNWKIKDTTGWVEVLKRSFLLCLFCWSNQSDWSFIECF